MLPEARLRLAAAEAALPVGPERGDDLIDRLTVWGTRIRRFARGGRHGNVGQHPRSMWRFIVVGIQ